MNYLILLAHADDESLGTGGTIPYLIDQGHDIQLRIVSEGIIGMRASQDDNRKSFENACQILGLSDVNMLGYPDQQFEQSTIAELTNSVSNSLSHPSPDVIISHSSKDLNKDHRIVAEVAKILGRPRSKQTAILACEIPFSGSWNGQPFQPTYFIDIEPYLETKLKAFSQYSNESRPFPDPFSEEGLRTLAKYRGMESGYRAAEAFEVVRWYGSLH
ncbi:MAG: PIG-L deacetylase family protein [Bacteroidota bacterium]